MIKVNKYETALQKYYQANQISANMNILDIVASDNPKDRIKPSRCAYEVFKLSNTWLIDTKNTNTDEEKCYRCRQKIKAEYPDFQFNSSKVYVPNPLEIACRNCYSFLIRKFTESNSKIVLEHNRKGKRYV